MLDKLATTPIDIEAGIARLAGEHGLNGNGAAGNGDASAHDVEHDGDPGADNIGRAGELVSQAFADCNEEAAARAIALGEAELAAAEKFRAHCYALGDAAMAEAMRFNADCKGFAAAKRQEGRREADNIERFFATRKKLASGLTALREMTADATAELLAS